MIRQFLATFESRSNPAWLNPPPAWLMTSLIAIILVIDAFLLDFPKLIIHGAADEAGHAITALIWVLAARAVGLPINLVIGVAAGVLIDLDHLPYLLNLAELPHSQTRAVSHSLLTALIFLAIGLLIPLLRTWGWAAAVAVVSHLFRDMATGELRFWWPFRVESVSIPYEVYIGLTLLLALIALRPRPLVEDQPIHPNSVPNVDFR